MHFAHSSVDGSWRLRVESSTLIESALACSPPHPLSFFSVLSPQIDIIRCIIRPLIHHGNGLGRSVAQMCFSLPHRWLCPKPQSPFSFSSSFFCSSKGLAAAAKLGGGWVGVEQQEEEGDVIEGWNHAIPQGAPTSLSPSSLLFNPGDPLERQGLWQVF